MDDTTNIINDGARVSSAWVFAGLTWNDIAAILAAVYTCLLICEWFWKRLLRPVAENKGWIERKTRRAGENDGDN